MIRLGIIKICTNAFDLGNNVVLLDNVAIEGRSWQRGEEVVKNVQMTISTRY